MTQTQSREFTQNLRKYFQEASEALFKELEAGEELTLNLNAEDQLYIRFNGNLVRQNTNVEQINLTLSYHGNGRSVSSSTTVSGRVEQDLPWLSRLLKTCREEARVLPADPHQVPFQNNGESFNEFRGEMPAIDQLLDSITGPAAGLDLAGFFAGGAIIRANRNSHGQDHWFATETFFMDYSLYDGPRAAKGVYAGSSWNHADWHANINRTREQLELLKRPQQDVKPGRYRTYLASGAVAELLWVLNWGGFSASAWKQGFCPFKRLAEGEAKLSPQFTLKENFSLGLCPRFNSIGEVAPESLTIIENGQHKEFLVSSKTAKEYGLKANAAENNEGARSPEILPGSLDESKILKEIGTGLYLSNLHYLNWSDRVAARVTGMTRYACFWVENGEIVGPIKDLRFDESMYEALGPKLIGLTGKAEIEPTIDTYGRRSVGGVRVPGMLIDDFTFTL